jgi:hypothetical protein
MAAKNKTPPKQLSLRVFSDLNERTSLHVKSQLTNSSAGPHPMEASSSTSSRCEASDADMAIYLAIANRYLNDA